MSDVYAWIDPFEEVRRANRAELSLRRTELDLYTVSKGWGRRLIDIWDEMARYIVRDVAKPYAYEHGSEAIEAIAAYAEIAETRSPETRGMTTFTLNVIRPIYIASRVYDDGRPRW